jgi:excisionase family DNA binding protein
VDFNETTESAQIDANRLLTSHQASALLQVTPGSILNWVKAGHLAAFRTPGGHLRIRTSDLVSFMREHHMPIPSDLDPGRVARVLMVDDDQKQLRAYKRLLKPYTEKIELAVADNGVDALVLVGAFKPQLVVLDVFMPELDGIEVCRRLKTNPDTRHIDIIVVSAHLTPELERRAQKAGVKRCLSKPLKPKLILEVLGIGEGHARGQPSRP